MSQYTQQRANHGHFILAAMSLRLEAKWDINYTMARNRLAGMSDIEADYGLAPDLRIKGPLLSPIEFTDFTPYARALPDKLDALVRMAKRNARTVYLYLLERQIGSPLLLFLVVLALFRHSWSNRRLTGELLMLLMAVSIVFIVLTSSTVEFRYFFPVVPLLLVWAGKSVEELGEWVKGWELLRERARSIPIVVQLCAVALTIALSVQSVGQSWLSSREMSGVGMAAREAGLWLRLQEPEAKRIATLLAVVPYYAKATLINFPYADPEVTKRYLAKERVDFVVLKSEDADSFPTVREWIAHGIPDPSATPARFGPW